MLNDYQSEAFSVFKFVKATVGVVAEFTEHQLAIILGAQVWRSLGEISEGSKVRSGSVRQCSDSSLPQSHTAPALCSQR